MSDDPIPIPESEAPFAPPAEEAQLRAAIRRLVEEQPFAVLATQGEGQPYASLVAFAFERELSAFVFATPTATHKYRLLCECAQVALLVDDRVNHPGALMAVSALTVTGRAGRVEAGPGFEACAGLLIGRHPYLEDFVRSPATALFRVEVARFLYVTRFQEARQWIPKGETG